MFVRARIRIARLRIAATSRALGVIATAKNHADVVAARSAAAAERQRRLVAKQRAAALKKKAEMRAAAARKRQEMKVALMRSSTFSKIAELVGPGRSGRVVARSQFGPPVVQASSTAKPRLAALLLGRRDGPTMGSATSGDDAAGGSSVVVGSPQRMRTASALVSRNRLQGAARAVATRSRPDGSARIAELFVDTVSSAPVLKIRGAQGASDGAPNVAGGVATDQTAVDLTMFLFLGGRRARRYDVLAHSLGNQRRQVATRAAGLAATVSASARALLDGTTVRDVAASWSARRLEARVAAGAWKPDISLWRALGGRVAVFTSIDDRPTAVDVSVFMYLGGNLANRRPASSVFSRVASVVSSRPAPSVAPRGVVPQNVDLTYWEFIGGRRAVSWGCVRARQWHVSQCA